MNHPQPARRPTIVAIVLLLLFLPLTGFGAYEPLTWWLEIAPILVAVPFLWRYGTTGRLSVFLLAFIVVHGLILAVGGHYTYARVPLGEWVRDLGIGSRNNYDKLGHFYQGVMPALVIREVFLRLGLWRGHPGFLGALAVLAAGGVSAFYEVLEMSAALALGSGADEFLGTQGYVWDTQTDMALALAGALLAVLLFNKAHAKSVEATR
jgi:putative membrane protein